MVKQMKTKMMMLLLVIVAMSATSAMAGTLALSISGQGSIEATVDGNKTIYTGAVVLEVPDGTPVAVHAEPAPGSGFRRWYLDGVAKYGDRVITVTGARTLQAIFQKRLSYTVDTSTLKGGSGSVDILCSDPAQNRTLPAGQNASLTLWENTWIKATFNPDAGSFARWYVNGVGPKYNGSYTASAIRSDTAILVTFKASVPTALTAIISPSGGTSVLEGGSYTFSTTASGGTAPYAYQWQLDGADIGGATKSSLAITGATEDWQGWIGCKVTDNVSATARSNWTELLVDSNPANQLFLVGIAFKAGKMVLSFDPNGLTPGSVFNGLPGGLQWSDIEVHGFVYGPIYNFDTTPSAPVDRYHGACWQKTGIGDLGGDAHIVWYCAYNDTQYWYWADRAQYSYNGVLMGTTANLDHLCPIDTGPTLPAWDVTLAPVSVVTTTGKQAAFFCDGTYTMPATQDPDTWIQPPLMFGWIRNGAAVGNARALIIPSVNSADAGTYSCLLTAPDKELSSGAASLTVN